MATIDLTAESSSDDEPPPKVARVRDPRDEALAEEARRFTAERQTAELREWQEKLNRASVYVVCRCKSERDDTAGSSAKPEYATEVLGVYFDQIEANRRAREAVVEIEGDYDGDPVDDDRSYFCWDNEESEYTGDFDRVYVDRRPIEDASSEFHV